MSKASRHNKVQNYESALKPVNKPDPRAVCKHCVHLNKSLPMEAQLPTNHWLRDNRDPCKRFTCPVMLQSRCDCCLKKGHVEFWCTEKGRLFCSNVDYMKTVSDTRRAAEAERTRVQPVSMPTSNAFACLDTGSPSSLDQDTKKKHRPSKRPATPPRVQEPEQPVKVSYAAYAKGSQDPPRTKKRSLSPSPEEIAAFKANPPLLVRGCWADVVDDDFV